MQFKRVIRRWMVNGLGVVLVLLLILEVAMSIVIRSYYYQQVQSSLYTRVRPVCELLETYINEGGYVFAENAYSWLINRVDQIKRAYHVDYLFGDIDRELNHIRVLGKGSKERIIYLNGACREALGLYLTARDAQGQVEHASRNALFLSSRNKRIHKRTVQWMVYKYLDLAGLSHKKCSVHKLRHTAATLMYRSGEVDIRVLKDILGHEQLSTTQIYTHVSDSDMERAMTQNPLAGIHPGTIPEKE